ncbi:MAG: hypothetical protein ACXQS8_04145 [Candidatus Helarchaeales archaeon]
MTRTCPFCNRNVLEKDKWCPWCGKRLPDDTAPGEKLGGTKESAPTPEPVPKEPKVSKPAPSVVELPMPLDAAIEQYLLRARIDRMNEKLKEAKQKIDQYLEKIEREGATISEEDLNELKEIVQKIKNKRSELEAQKKPLPFDENLLEKRQSIEGKMRKLQNKFMTQKISEIAYKKLKDEFEAELNEIKKKMSQQQNFERALKKKLEERQKALEEELEVLKAKLEIQELTEEAYEQRSKAIQKELEEIKLVFSKLVV